MGRSSAQAMLSGVVEVVCSQNSKAFLIETCQLSLSKSRMTSNGINRSKYNHLNALFLGVLKTRSAQITNAFGVGGNWESISRRITRLREDEPLRQRRSFAAIEEAKSRGGWDP
jgi:hypothetical protein